MSAEKLADLLPTTAARWSASLTGMLMPFGFFLPHSLSPLWPKSTEAEIVLAQMLLPALIAVAGSLIALWSVVVRCKELQQEVEKLTGRSFWESPAKP